MVHTNLRRNIIWFNPRFNLKFKLIIVTIKLFDKHFTKNSLLYKIINMNTVKIRHNFSSNLETTIKKENAGNFQGGIQDNEINNEICNCRNKKRVR